MKTLISVGCSFAFGHGLKYQSKRYSYLLATKYQRRLLDYSRGGSSNEYIASSCAAAINAALKNNRPEDIVVLVGWTDQSRLMLFDTKLNDIASVFPHRNRSKTNHIDEFIGKYAWHDSFGVYKLYHSFNYVNMMCRAQNIKCLHLANLVAHAIPLPYPQNKSTRILYDILGAEDSVEFGKLFSYNKSFIGLIESDPERFRLTTDDFHPNEEAHHCWAEKISEANDDILGS